MSFNGLVGIVALIFFVIFSLSMVFGPYLINHYKEKGEVLIVDFLVIFDGKIKLTAKGRRIQRYLRCISLISFVCFVAIYSLAYLYLN